MPRSSPTALSPQELSDKTLELADRLADRLPNVDRGDLILILQSLLRPIGSGRRFFLRKLRSSGHVP